MANFTAEKRSIWTISVKTRMIMVTITNPNPDLAAVEKVWGEKKKNPEGGGKKKNVYAACLWLNPGLIAC